MLVHTYTVSEHLHRKQHPRRRRKATKAGHLEDWRSSRILAGEESLDCVVEPARRKSELLSDLRRGLVDGVLRLEHGIDVALARRVS